MTTRAATPSKPPSTENYRPWPNWPSVYLKKCKKKLKLQLLDFYKNEYLNKGFPTIHLNKDKGINGLKQGFFSSTITRILFYDHSPGVAWSVFLFFNQTISLIMNDYKHSLFREALLENKFLADFFEHIWLNDLVSDIEIMKPTIDNAGYDLVIANSNKTLFLQLKGKKKGARNPIPVNEKLFSKPKAGILLIECDDTNGQSIQLNYRYLNTDDLEPNELPNAKHPKGDANGEKKEKPHTKKVNIGQFQKKTFKEVVDLLLH